MRRSGWLQSLVIACINVGVGGWMLVDALHKGGILWVLAVANGACAAVNIASPVLHQRRKRRLQREYRESQEVAARLGRDPEFQHALREALREIGEEE